MVELSKQCDIYQGYNYRKDKQTNVGFLTKIKIGDLELSADQTCKDPTAPETDVKAVAVLNMAHWGVGVTDAVYLGGQVSVANKQKIMQLMYKDLTKVDVEFEFTVYEYDPLKKQYFKCFCFGDTTLKGILEKNGDELAMGVSDDASTEVQSPQNHAFHVGIKPQPEAQTVTIATGFSANVVKAWGLTVAA
jgi:hypothetical protein